LASGAIVEGAAAVEDAAHLWAEDCAASSHIYFRIPYVGAADTFRLPGGSNVAQGFEPDEGRERKRGNIDK
jgi:hypothetical protein